MTIDIARFIEELTLDKGAHSPDHTFCVMEAVAYVAGEPWSDQPQCASPVITRYCQVLNDRWPTEQRQALKPYIRRLVNTRNPALESKRMFMCADAAVRVFAPLALDAAGRAPSATKLRQLPAIVDRASALVGKNAASADSAATYATYAAYYAASADSAATYADYADSADSAAAYAASAASAATYAALELLDRLIEVTK